MFPQPSPHATVTPVHMSTSELRFATLEQVVQALQTRVAALESKGAAAPRGSGSSGSFFGEFVGGERIPCISSREDLIEPDGTIKMYADPKVFKDPPPTRWKGESYAGKNYSDCPPEYLRVLASLKRWQAGKEHEEKRMAKNGKPAWLYSLRDASKADGWAKLIEESQRAQGPQPPAPVAGPAGPLGYAATDVPEDDLPF